jgi:hypothetical protein
MEPVQTPHQLQVLRRLRTGFVIIAAAAYREQFALAAEAQVVGGIDEGAQRL